MPAAPALATKRQCCSTVQPWTCAQAPELKVLLPVKLLISIFISIPERRPLRECVLIQQDAPENGYDGGLDTVIWLISEQLERESLQGSKSRKSAQI